MEGAAEFNEVKALIQQGVDVNARNHEHEAALTTVTRAWSSALHNEDAKSAQCSMDIITQLLDHGADPNVQDKDGRTALVLAIEARSPNVSGLKGMDDLLVRSLVERGARLDPVSPYDAAWPTTPLITAVLHKRFNAMELLLSKKVNVNAQIGGKTALDAAISTAGDIFPKRISIFVGQLLEHGADVKGDERRILASAISRSPESVERFLVECYGNPQPELGWDEESEEGKVEFPEGQYEKLAATLSLSGVGGGYKPVTEKMRKAYMYLLDKKTEAISFVKRLSSQIAMEEEAATRVEVLCSSCRAFETEALNREWFSHSPNSESVHRSILGGCPMCQLIKDCLPKSFQEVSLYYYSALSESDTLSKNYYERIIVRGQVPNNSIYGELRLATLDGTSPIRTPTVSPNVVNAKVKR